MGLPFNYNQITINQLQTIQPFLQNEKHWVKIIGYFLNKTDEQIESFDLKYYRYCVRKLSFLTELPKPKVKVKKHNEYLIKSVNYSPKKNKYLFLKGILYKSATSVNYITTGDYISIKQVMSEQKEIECLHTLCAIVYKKMIGKDDIPFADKEHLFKNISVQKAYNTLFFCLEVLVNWNLNTQDYLESAKTLKKHIKELKTWQQSLEPIGTGIV